MNSKTGIVMEIKNNRAYIMTPGGEFEDVKIAGSIPSIGSTYTGQSYKKPNFYKYAAAAAACLVFFTSIGGGAYAYYTPTASIVLDINPSLELKVNRWSRIIKAIPLNDDGKKLVSSLNLNNKNIDRGLNMILDEAKEESFLTDDNAENEQVTLTINSTKNKSLDLPEFKANAKSKNLDVKINYGSNNHKNGIIEDTEKTDKSSNNNNSNSSVESKDNNVKSSSPKSETNSKGNSSNSDKENSSNQDNKSTNKVKDNQNSKSSSTNINKKSDYKNSSYKENEVKEDNSKSKGNGSKVK